MHEQGLHFAHLSLPQNEASRIGRAFPGAAGDGVSSHTMYQLDSVRKSTPSPNFQLIM